MKLIKNILLLSIMLVLLGSFVACGKSSIQSETEDKTTEFETEIAIEEATVKETGQAIEETGWNVPDYGQLEDIVSIKEIEVEQAVKTVTYSIRYQSDDCEVVSYLSIPKECLEQKTAYPCIIYNRGGNREFNANKASDIAYLAETSEKIVFASQYRGVSGGTGEDEFGGADLQDVLKLVDLCEDFAFVDMEQLYMMGISRGGMMTYMAAREDDRIKKVVVVSGIADAFMSYEDRDDMKEVFHELVGGTPEEIPTEFEKRSATYWADELKCPILLIHSKQDESVAYAQAEKMAECLENAGKEYKLVTYEDDVHGLHPQDFEIIMEWFQSERGE